MGNKQHIVVDKENDQEFSFNTMFEARHKLMELVMLGIAAYIFTAPLYKI